MEWFDEPLRRSYPCPFLGETAVLEMSNHGATNIVRMIRKGESRVGNGMGIGSAGLKFIPVTSDAWAPIISIK